MMDQINRLWRRLYNVVGRGEIRRVDDTKNVQRVQVMFSPLETRDNTIRAAEFGFSSNPPIGSDCLVLFVGGDRDNGIVISTGHKASRPINLQPGESVLYNDQGSYVLLKANGDIYAKSTTQVIVDAPTAHFTGNVQVDGTLTADTDVIGGGKHLKTHTHGGVTAGGANTGPPT